MKHEDHSIIILWNMVAMVSEVTKIKVCWVNLGVTAVKTFQKNHFSNLPQVILGSALDFTLRYKLLGSFQSYCNFLENIWGNWSNNIGDGILQLAKRTNWTQWRPKFASLWRVFDFTFSQVAEHLCFSFPACCFSQRLATFILATIFFRMIVACTYGKSNDA